MKELNIPESIINTNSDVLDSAYRDVLKARNSTIAASVAMKLKTGTGFKLDKLKYRSKKAYSESIEIPTESIESGVAGKNLFVEICTRSFKFKDKVKYKPCIRQTSRTRAQIKIDAEKRVNAIKRIKDYNNSVSQIKIKIPLPKLNYAVRLQKIKPNIYYMCIPITKNIEPIITNKICSIDPGVRTMLTVLDPEDLSSNTLTNISSEIKKLTNLTRLSLSYNYLTSLPSEIGNLTNLTGLYLSNNELTNIPSEIGKLTNLTNLYLNGNKLISVPSEIGKLTNLTQLYLSSNKLVNIPSEINNLTDLTSLNLYYNKLAPEFKIQIKSWFKKDVIGLDWF